MDLIQAFLGEHALFYALFEQLETTLSQADSLGEAKRAAGLMSSALITHAALEEDLLFRTLEQRVGAMPPLIAMRAEHDQIDDTLREIANVEQSEDAVARLLGVVALARRHFAKEEQVLFPMARRTLGDEVLTELGAQWAEARRVVVR